MIMKNVQPVSIVPSYDDKVAAMNPPKSSFLSLLMQSLLVVIMVLGIPGFFLGWGFGQAAVESEMRAILMNTVRDKDTDYNFDYYRKEIVSDPTLQSHINTYYAVPEPAMVGIKARDISPYHKVEMMKELTLTMPDFSDRTIAQHTRMAFAVMLKYSNTVLVIATLLAAWLISRKARVWKRRYNNLYNLFAQLQMEVRSS